MTHPSNKDPKAVFLTLSFKNIRGKGLATSASSPLIVTCFLIKSHSSRFHLNILPSKNFVFNCSYSDIIETHLDKKRDDINSFCLFEGASGKMCCGTVGNITLKHIGEYRPPLLPLGQYLIILLLFPENEHVIKVKHILVQNENPVILCCKCNSSLFELNAKLNFIKSASSFIIEDSSHLGQKVSISFSRVLKHFKLCRHTNIVNSNTFKSNQRKRKKGRWKRDADGTKVDTQHQGHHDVNSRIVRRNTSDVLNSSYFIEILKQKQMRKQLELDSESAAYCLVFISCLMLFFLWYLRGFHNRNANYREVTFHDRSHILTVKEVLFRKRHYLPMFNQGDGFEEVLVHDCGNDP